MPDDHTKPEEDDPLDGHEIALLNGMITVLTPGVKEGDREAIEQVIKILQLRRLYKRDKQIERLE